MAQTGQTLRTTRKHDAWQVLVTKSLERGDSLFLRARTEDLTVIKGAVEEVQADCADWHFGTAAPDLNGGIPAM